MPPFWLIFYGELVWNRVMCGFVPICVIMNSTVDKPITAEFMDKFRFYEESAVDAQMDELSQLGCTHHIKKVYGNSERVR